MLTCHLIVKETDIKHSNVGQNVYAFPTATEWISRNLDQMTDHDFFHGAVNRGKTQITSLAKQKNDISLFYFQVNEDNFTDAE